MNIKEKRENNKLILLIEGKIDSLSAPTLSEYLKKELEGVSNLEIDLKQTEYVSSAGIRALLLAQKIMDKQGQLVILNVNDEIKELLDLTGVSQILTIN